MADRAGLRARKMLAKWKTLVLKHVTMDDLTALPISPQEHVTLVEVADISVSLNLLLLHHQKLDVKKMKKPACGYKV